MEHRSSQLIYANKFSHQDSNRKNSDSEKLQRALLTILKLLFLI